MCTMRGGDACSLAFLREPTKTIGERKQLMECTDTQHSVACLHLCLCLDVAEMTVDNTLWTPASLMRLVIEATCMLLLLATAIGNLSGYSWLPYSTFQQGLPNGYPSSTQQAKASSGAPAGGLTLNAAVLQEEMHKARILISACYDEKRKSQREFLVCLGRVECDVASQATNMDLKSARHVLTTPHGQEKALNVMRSVVSHFSKQLGTSDLSKIFAEAGRVGLACDTLQV
ncbi:hypothetical protein TGMAS_209700 [Toxoplasma gondii MAS]|uniref:Uncharacterized protein n=1 Tax=Toxoplasma gondii MAS TaxID=943118 RepID=A0A086QS78_TOXGO|nr:hypothetical protein TGMAS_209700 [Toxoplasma gondii MAS]